MSLAPRGRLGDRLTLIAGRLVRKSHRLTIQSRYAAFKDGLLPILL